MAVVYEFNVDPAQAPEFVGMMKQVRMIHLRNGAFTWRLHEDLTRHNTFRIEMLVPSWTQHLLQRERMTKAEKAIIDKANAFHAGGGPMEERIFLCVNDELGSRRFR